MTVTADTELFAKGKLESLSKRQAAIFDRVMRVHFQVALANELQIEGRVLREEREHVIKKRNPRFDPGISLAVQVQMEGNLGFLGAA